MREGGGGGSTLVQHYPSRDIVRRGGEAEEEWVTKKKVEITTTKNVEKKIQRQVVLEDGRVVEEEIPTVTLDTTQDSQTFETDHDEERKVEEGSGMELLQSKFPSKSGLLVGDKFTSVKKIQDVKENIVKTEAATNMGDIRSKDLNKVMKENEDIRKYIRKNKNSGTEVALPTRVTSKRNHRVITDKEDIQERNWLNDGKMQNERIKTEEHIEYDSDDTPDSGASSDSVSSRHKLEPEVYKTRKDENFVEYFKIDRSTGKEKLVKVGEGAHYVAESKELELEQDRAPLPHRSPRLTHVDDSIEKRSRKQVTHTDSWLERHFGSSSSELSASSVDMSVRGPGSQVGGGGGLRRSASICDIRPVTQASNVYYATVRKTGKIPPVTRREKKDDYYQENRRSAHFTSSGTPVRPPRRKKNTDSESSHYMSQSNLYESNNKSFAERQGGQKPEYIYGTLKKSGNHYSFSRDELDSVGRRSKQQEHQASGQRSSENTSSVSRREMRENEKNLRHHAPTPTEKYYFGRPGTVSNSAATRSSYHHSSNSRSYSPAPQKVVRSSKSHHQSTGNIYAQSLGRKPKSPVNTPSSGMTNRAYHGSTGNIYKTSGTRPLEHSPKSHHQSTGNIYRSSRNEHQGSSGRIYRSSQNGHQRSEKKYTNSKEDHNSSVYRSSKTEHQRSRSSPNETNNNVYQAPVMSTLRRDESSGSRTREIPIMVSADIYASTPKPVFAKNSQQPSSPKDTGVYGTIGREAKNVSRDIYATPEPRGLHQTRSRDMTSGRSKVYGGSAVYGSPRNQNNILYSTDSPSGSPSTKYRTKIVLNGGLA